LQHCPSCQHDIHEIELLPLNVSKIAELMNPITNSRKHARSGSLHGYPITSILAAASSSSNGEHDWRVGKWTLQETVYCEKLMQTFEGGMLPLMMGTKLHEFLSSMLHCKQSRLTKKFINAKLSSKSYASKTGWLHDKDEAMEFSKMEDDFLQNVEDPMEQAELEFHLQKEWREHFSSVCASYQQPLQASAWLDSWAEAMDHRSKRARDAAMEARQQLRLHAAMNTAMTPYCYCRAQDDDNVNCHY
jgi:hypothetical protein